MKSPRALTKTDAVGCDLRDLFAELAALRQEVRLQNREQARAARGDEALAMLEERACRTAEDRCLAATLKVRDALVRGRDAAVRLRIGPGCSGARRAVSPASSRATSLRSDGSTGCSPVLTSGAWRPWAGPSTARSCTRWRRAASTGWTSGLVVEELRSGIVRGDVVLRLADVALNRRNGQE